MVFFLQQHDPLAALMTPKFKQITYLQLKQLWKKKVIKINHLINHY